MSHEIARELIEREIATLRLQCYADLVARMGKSEPKELLGRDGNRYRFAVKVFWDSKKGGDIRVMVGIGGEGISAFRPVTADFTMAPDGTLGGKPDLL